MKSIVLTIVTIFATATVYAQSMESKGPYSCRQVAFNEQKFLADRCRLIKQQILQEAIAAGQQRGSGHVQRTVMEIENYLASVATPLAFQMLGDLQNAGYSGFDAWCSHYGI